MLTKTPIYIVLMLCLATVYTLFNIKDRVMSIRTELSEVKKQMQNELDTIHLLKAEFAYLGSPERLKRLNENYLKLKDTQISQMTIDPLNKNELVLNKQIVSSKIIQKSNVKWRYKKGPSKYLTMVSAKR